MKTKLIHQYRWLAAVLLLVVMLTGLAGAAQAAVIVEGDGNIPKDQTIEDDVFLSGKNVVIDGTVKGILFAAGERVTLNGVIDGDAFLAGQDVVVSDTAQINGNLFVGARSVKVDGKVTGSVFVGAADYTAGKTLLVGRNMYTGLYSLKTESGSVVTKDLLIGGYQAMLDGEVKGNLAGGMSALDLNGKVGGNVEVNVEKPGQSSKMDWATYNNYPGMPAQQPSGLRIGKNAQIGGKVTYTSEMAQENAIEAKPSGGIVYQTPVPDAQDASKKDEAPQAAQTSVAMGVLGWIWGIAQSLITLLLLGGLALWLVPGDYQRAAYWVGNRPAASLGYGTLITLVTYVGSLLALAVIILISLLLFTITLGGLGFFALAIGFATLTLVMLGFTFIVAYVSKLVVVFWGGQWLLRRFAPNIQRLALWGLVLGVVIYVLIEAIPVLGALVGLLVTLVGVGAIWIYVRSLRTAPPVASQPPGL